MFVLACMLHRAQFSDISQAHISFWKRFHASLCGCITTRHLFFFLLQPVQTDRHTKAEPPQPAVVHQVRTEMKNRFFTEWYRGVADFIWKYFDVQYRFKKKKKKHTHRRTENMYLHDTRRGKQCGVTWAKECRKWAKKSFITRNQLPNNWSWKRKTNLEHIYTHDVGPACTQE